MADDEVFTAATGQGLVVSTGILGDLVLPDVLADRYAKAHAAKRDRARQLARREHAFLVEDAVVRQIDLVADGGDLALVQQDDRGNWPIEQFDALIAANKRDFDTRLAKARVLMAEGQWTAAMDELLEIVMRDKAWQDGVARKTYVAILELLTPPKPKGDAGVPGKSAGGIELMGKSAQQQDETQQLLDSYRRRLSMALN